uniref:Transmembrane protein 157 n=1 Tax=Molossus molossus TaxID=27622 RepID=A0A7J8IXP5_MOLMO|nr:family with sequence similarity 174 member A [Molossus molossus]
MWMRRRNRKTRRYGVLDTNIENMELTPLEQDDEDDDNTLFDANHPRR